MCGIAGALHLDGAKADASLLRRMIEKIPYRGPDDSGVYTDQQVGLAHVRLSILDLAGGHQPMHDDSGSLSITFNGEIFNYKELREEWLRKGHRFATHSDTEVILHHYAEKGEKCVEDFNGQWAFAIWDKKKRKLFLSRDRLGVRPLFYTLQDRTFLFASEMKSLLAYPGMPRQIDPVALDQIFTYWSALPPRTIFKGIQELPPGTSLTVQNGTCKTQRYWQLNYPSDGHRPGGPKTDQEYTSRLMELLVDAARLRLRADVPVGAYLSGGLDSSVIAAVIKKCTDTPLKTFSVAFDDPEFDESSYQKEVSNALGVERHEVRCTHEAIGQVFPRVIWQTERPILRTAPAPLFILSELVRDNGYKVVLTGEGSDEMLGGYDIFKEAKIRRFWGARPDSKIRPLLLKKLYPYLPRLQMQSTEYLKAFFRVDEQDLSSPFFSHLPRWGLTSMLKMFFSDDLRAELRRAEPLPPLEADLPEDYFRWDPLCQAQYLESAYLLPGYILSSQGDRMAMAHSIEGRFPFLDHRVVEFAASIPPRLKMKALNEKYILKRGSEGLIPDSVRNRPKQPYRAPEGKSFFTAGKGRDYVESLLSPDRIQKSGLFQPAAVEKLVDKFRRGRAIGIKDNMALVGILSSQLVSNQFVENLGAQS
ncbi:MAG: asparagine synthase (glutamine-hydrolyzing) [Elusimicrobiota bacterium]|jgi:asparagine synthase (glutamine-hydrolysing)